MTKLAKFFLVAILGIVCPVLSYSQGTSNKGTDFWIGYMGHIDGTGSAMKLYVTSDVSTTGTVSVPGQSWSQSFTVTANTVTVLNIPPTTAYVGCDDCTEKKGIRVVSVAPVVVYSHIHANARSDATLALPTATLGREYIAMSFTQKAQSATQRSQFMVVATEDSTTVEITPTVSSVSGSRSANSTFTLLLMKGEAYQFRSATDISGSHIISVSGSNGSSCKRIAVFSGSSFTQLGCTNSSSGDNLYQQLYPVSAWGKRFITVPMKTRSGGDYFRAMASVNNTRIFINNSYVANLNRGQFYEFLSSSANYVNATEPITLAQYQRTQNCDNVTGDPSMTILAPIEQGLNDITVYSSPFQNISNHHINVVMSTNDTANFTLDNNKVIWSTVSSNTQYAYSQTTVSAGNHILHADSQFNAVAYGFGNVESYGYAAGANVKNLSHYVSVVNNASGAACLGIPTQFKINTNYTPSKYKWYLGDKLFSDSAQPIILFDTLGTYKMAVVTIRSNQNDCESQDSTALSITVRPQPEARFTAPKGCLSDTLNFYDSSTVTGPSTINKWRWDLGDGTFNPTQHIRKKYDSAYVHNVRLVVTTIHGCADTLIKPVPVYPMPKPGFTTANVCIRDSAFFTDTSKIDSTNIVGYKWLYGDGESALQQNPTHTFPYADTFSVQLTTTSDMGCKDSVTATIVVYPRPFASIQTHPVCLYDTTLLADISTTTSDYIVQRQWWTGAFFIDTLKNKKWLPADTGLHPILLLVTNNLGCTDTATALVDVYSKPNAAYKLDDFCYTDSARFIDESTVDEGQITKWLWVFGDGGGTFNFNPGNKYATPGVYNTSLVVESDKGCKDTAYNDVNAFDVPEVKFYISDVCVYDSAIFSDSSVIKHGTLTGRFWQLGDGNTDTAAMPRHKYSVLGAYPVKLSLQISGLCIAESQKLITIYPRPKADFVFKNNCVGVPFVFNDNSTVSAGSILQRNWNLGTKTDVGTLVTNTYTTDGTIPVSLSVITDFGCRDTIIKPIIVFPAPLVSFTTLNNCFRDTTKFVDTVSLSSGNIVSYDWEFGDGYIDTGRFPSHGYLKFGKFYPSLKVRTNNDCIDSAREQIIINPLPRIRININDTDGCRPYDMFFEDVSTILTGVIEKRTWQFGDGETDTGKNIIHTYKKAGDFSPILTVESEFGCKSDSLFQDFVTVYDLPKAEFVYTPDSVSFFNPIITITDSSSTDVLKWKWDFGNGDISGEPSPVYEYRDTGRYTIRQIVTTINGCEDTAFGKVFISPDYTMFIPNAFTPDAGELNPTFGPSGIFQGIVEYKMDIYNRWGEKMFETDDIYKRWDGKYKDDEATNGVYIYQISIMDYFHKRRHYRGTVLLMR